MFSYEIHLSLKMSHFANNSDNFTEYLILKHRKIHYVRNFYQRLSNIYELPPYISLSFLYFKQIN